MSTVQLLTLDDARTVLREDLSELREAHELNSTSRRSGNDKYLSGSDVQEALCISKATLARWRSDKTIRFSRIGGKLIYLQSDIDRLVQENIVTEEAS